MLLSSLRTPLSRIPPLLTTCGKLSVNITVCNWQHLFSRTLPTFPWNWTNVRKTFTKVWWLSLRTTSSPGQMVSPTMGKFLRLMKNAPLPLTTLSRLSLLGYVCSTPVFLVLPNVMALNCMAEPEPLWNRRYLKQLSPYLMSFMLMMSPNHVNCPHELWKT